MKVCRICKKEKTLEEFYKRKDSPDGYRNDCKECSNERNVKTRREWRKRKKDNIVLRFDCKNCGENFETKYTKQVFCSKKCKEQYRAKHSARRKLWKLFYYIKNRDKIREHDRKNYLANEKKYRLYSKRFAKSEKGKECFRNSRHKRRSACKETDITTNWLVELKKRTSSCQICNEEMNEIRYHPKSKSLDHIIPINMGGKHKKYNVRFICFSCNNGRPNDGSDILRDETLNEWIKQEYLKSLELRKTPTKIPEKVARLVSLSRP